MCFLSFTASLLESRFVRDWCQVILSQHLCCSIIYLYLIKGLYLVRYAQSEGIDDHRATALMAVVEIANFVMCPVASILTNFRFEKEVKCGEKNYSSILTASGHYFYISGSKTCILSALRRSYVLAIFQFSMSLVLIYPTIADAQKSFAIYASLLGLCWGMCVCVFYLYILRDLAYF